MVVEVVEVVVVEVVEVVVEVVVVPLFVKSIMVAIGLLIKYFTTLPGFFSTQTHVLVVSEP